MMRGFRATIPLVLGALVAGGLFQYARWKTFAPEGGRFSIEIPGAGGNLLTLGLGRPQRSEEAIDTLVGKVDMLRYSTGHWGKAFGVGYVDFPESAGSLTKLDALFDGVALSIQAKYGKGEVTRQHRVTIGEHPGRETFLDIEKEVGHYTIAYRTYLVERRLFLLVAAVPTLVGADHYPAIERFFESFELASTTSR